MPPPVQPAPIPLIRYEDLEPKLRTGDLMLLHGSATESLAIEALTHSIYSHVGMILRPDRTRPALVWQTGPTTIVKDPITGGLHTGAQLGLAGDVFRFIATHDEPIYVRQLQLVRTPDFEKRAVEVIHELEGTPFPTLWRMALDWVAGYHHLSTGRQYEFCAQLVADTFIQLRLLPPDPPANAYSPGEFGIGGLGVNLLPGAELGDEYLLDSSTLPTADTPAPAAKKTPAY